MPSPCSVAASTRTIRRQERIAGRFRADTGGALDHLIREATAQDVEALSGLLAEVNALHAAAFPHVFRDAAADAATADFVRQQLAEEDAQLFVAEQERRPIGYARVRLLRAPPLPILVPRRFAEIDTLVVSAPFRRGGVGRALVEAAHRWAAEQGVDQVQIVVWEFNREAVAFYERLGYATVRRTMWRSLGGRPG